MSLPPAYEILRKRGIRFVANAPNGTFRSNCTKCGRQTSNHVELDDDGLGARWRCDCGFSGAERVQPVRTQTDGRGASVPFVLTAAHKEALRALGYSDEQIRHLPPQQAQDILAHKRRAPDDDDEQRKLEEARRELEQEPEQEGAPEPEPAPEPEHKAPTIGEATALRRALVAAGYLPIPLYGKIPPNRDNNKHRGFTGWSSITSVTDEMIAMWAKTWPDATNTGILTRNVPTLDLDILNEEAVRACEDLVRDRYEDAGVFLVRIGQPPKRAILFRTDEPFKKFSVNLIAPNAAAGAKPEKIEMLGDGEQVVVAGIHPDTKRTYRWHGGEPGAVKREDLPYTREEEARGLVDRLLELLTRDFDYTPRERPGRPPGNGGDRIGGTEDWQYWLDNIHAGHELHDSLRNLAAKMVRAGMNGGAVVNFLRAEMERSSVPHDERWRERYDDIPRLVAGAEERFAEDELPPKDPPPKPQDPPPPQPRPQQGDPQPSTIEKTLAVYEHWLILPSRTPVYAMLGAAAANYLEGDPVWLGLIGPPSSAKTELLISTRALPEVALSATITEAGLLSGTPKKQYNKGAKGGLLREIGAFGILVLKDFGSILSMQRDARGTLLAAMREIYDGHWARDIGTGGGIKLVWDGKLGMLFGCTGVIDSHHAVLGAMGDRSLFSRLAPVAGKNQFLRALDHVGSGTKQMRKELAEAVGQLFAGRHSNPRPIDERERERIGTALALVVRLRGTLERDYRSRDIEAIYGAEGTGRLGLALERLLAGLDTIGVERETAMEVVLSVVMDSAPPLRRAAYECVCKYRNVETADVAIQLGLPTNTVRRILEDLAAYGLVIRRGQGQGKADLWDKADWETE